MIGAAFGLTFGTAAHMELNNQWPAHLSFFGAIYVLYRGLKC